MLNQQEVKEKIKDFFHKITHKAEASDQADGVVDAPKPKQDNTILSDGSNKDQDLVWGDEGGSGQERRYS